MLDHFVREAHIRIPLRSTSLEAAIEELIDFMRATYALDFDRAALLRSVLEREAEHTTCVGRGLAVPHGMLPEGMPSCAVVGLSPAGIVCTTPDLRPLHCVVLIATPRTQRDRHLLVLSALARTLGRDEARRALYAARTAAEAHRILGADAREGAPGSA